jgi:hypothetical protein
MKKSVTLLAAIFLLLVFSCKKVKQEKMTIIRDCSGTYLRFEGKDYHVCNFEKLETFPDNAAVTASFKKVDNCTDMAVCLLFHENEGWVEVTDIR